MRRLSSSLLLLLILLAAAAAGTGLLLHSLVARTEQRAEGAAQRTAAIVASLVVYRNVGEGAFGPGGLTAGQQSDMRADVNGLRAGGQLVGLEMWRADGSPVFVDDNHPRGETRLPTQELKRLGDRRPWTGHTRASGRGVATLDEFLPYGVDADNNNIPDGVVEVILPQQPLTRTVAAATRNLDLAAAGFLLLFSTGLVVVRRQTLGRTRQSRHDALTGLLNRDALVNDGDRLLAAGHGSQHHGLLVMDLNRFKTVNDTLGHAAGDALLQQVAGVVCGWAHPGDLVARTGGDEFAVLMPGLTEDDAGYRRAGDLLDRLSRAPFEVSGFALAVETSIGLALAPQHGQRLAELMQHADVAMYQAKGTRTGVAVYDEASDPYDVDQLHVLVDLRAGIDRGELVLFYQPKISVRDGRVTGVEALVRWQHPTRGLLAPDAFVPLAEDTGLIQPLTSWVLHEALRQAAAWDRAGSPLQVAVNISPRNLLEVDLATIVSTGLAAAGIPAALLELEITETAVMTDPARVAFTLRQLDALGVSMSMDDFGSGYTSLSYLRTLPITKLKIDRSLVTNILQHPQDLAITAAVIALGHELGMTVLAEGVETQAVLDRLDEMGCDQAQGYLMTRPLPASAVAEWVANHPVTAGQAHR